jgi:putative Mn2+ efflux pump MntP
VAAAFTTVGMLLGRRIGTIWGRRVAILGGLVLIGIGVKIVIEHLTA